LRQITPGPLEENCNFVAPYAGGSAFSSLIDVRAFLSFLNRRNSGNDCSPNPLTNARLVNNAPGNDSQYGLGLIHTRLVNVNLGDERQFVYHSGRISGYCCLMGLIPGDSIEVLVFSNAFLSKTIVDSVVKNELIRLGYSDLPSLDFEYEVPLNPLVDIYKILYWIKKILL